MDDLIVTEFQAKLKTIIARGGEVSTLDFLVEPAWMVAIAPLLKFIDTAFVLTVDGVDVWAKVGYLKFNGDGRVYVRLLADTKETIQQLQSKIDREISVEVKTKS